MPHAMLNAPAPDKEIYARIGMVASEWSYVELLLDEMLSHYCQADPGSMYVITRTVANASIIGWLRTLLEIKVKDLNTRDVITDLLNDIDAAREERNVIVHGNWTAHPDPGFGWVQTFNWERAEVVRNTLCSVADLDAQIAELQRLQGELGTLGLRIGFLKPRKPKA